VNARAEELEGIDPATELARRWGWSNPPDWVKEEAALHLEYAGLDASQIAVRLGYIEEREARRAMDKKSATARPLDVLAAHSARVSSNRNRIASLMANLPLVAQPLQEPSIQPHPDMERPEIAQALRKHECVLLKIEDRTPLLLFADYEVTLKRFQSIYGTERSQDPLYRMYREHRVALTSTETLQALLYGGETVAGTDNGTQGEKAEIVHDARIREMSEAMKKLANIMDLSTQLAASDVYLEPDNTGHVVAEHRVQGDVERLPGGLDINEYHQIKQFLLRASRAEIKGGRINEPKDGMIQYVGKSNKSAYVRCSFIPLGHSGGPGMDLVSICMRLIPLQRGRVNLADDGLRTPVISLMRNAMIPKAGIVLVCGATGSGKSNTVAGMVGLHCDLHGDRKKRYMIEDPVERFLPGIQQIQIPYHLRNDGTGFTLILRNLLRQAPDMISIGEIRDQETATTAVQAAATGHLIISTLHVDSASKAVERMVNLMPADRPDMKGQLLSNMSLVIAQRLVKELCPRCKTKEVAPTDEERDFAEYLTASKGYRIELPQRVSKRNPQGCNYAEGKRRCRNGIVGRLPVNEVLVFNREAQIAYMGNDPVKLANAMPNLLAIKMEDSIMELIREQRAEPEALRP
jgi:type IV pilus assembly protein PilB